MSEKDLKTIQSDLLEDPSEEELYSEDLEEILDEEPEEVEELTQEEAFVPGETKTELEKKKPKRKRWYIVHTYSGHENKVKVNLEKRIEFMNMGDKIFRVEVPEKTVSKVKDGKRVDKDERLFPGYVLVEMIMDDDSWYVVRHTPGVTKFVGAERKPIPAKDSEIKKILRRTQTKVTKVEIDIQIGDKVRIISGPFADFVGDVTEVYPDKEKLRANVSIFGRDTPVELEYNQIQKV
ncbi:MAG: transcription termination/antitermination protein NusG [Cyanobacteriota bacterium]